MFRRIGPWSLALVLLGCPAKPEEQGTDSDGTGATGPTSSGTTEVTDGGGDVKGPRESEWEVVVDALPFPLSGPGQIHTLTVGRKEFAENFANRGIVEVLFDHDAETITVELRKYVFGTELDAVLVFDRLALWAYVRAGNPTPPGAQDPADDCTQGAWKDDCAIHVYYDDEGKTQPARSGADFRVHLPKGYRGQLEVVTEDSDEEPSYPRRGDVLVDGLCGGGGLRLAAGRARVKMCRELTPAPTCPPADIQTCEAWPDGSGSEAWSADCPCGPELFGQLRVEAPPPWAANITVDIPEGVWLNATLTNPSFQKPHDCTPEVADCDPDACTLDATDPYALAAEFNYPGPAAPQGAGFNLVAVSGGCTVIPFVEPSAAWSEDQEPLEELRGLVRLCTGCL